MSYIGVADALKKFYGDEVKAKTIIGSSAGGILGLAFCLDLSQEEVVNIGIKGLSTITSEDKKYINN